MLKIHLKLPILYTSFNQFSTSINYIAPTSFLYHFHDLNPSYLPNPPFNFSLNTQIPLFNQSPKIFPTHA
ncbi:unnamed protein product [Moneuplotes crassus]|uniref:Uncharacterized protein n=1 Tax=Euplotes crassus TaxID=5936 RepID=A0AAD2D3E9_EUPCR|nr:unnamed protein product [Moneuplotes crassus]